jgi:hypothetical protein
MRRKTPTNEITLDRKDIDKINLSFNGLFEESNELLASLENLERQSSIMKTKYNEMLVKTDKLLDSMMEVTLLTR